MFERKITEYLRAWSKSKNRKPLIVRGARQVGKTSSIKSFGEENYKNFIYINLDNIADFDAFSGKYDLSEFEERLLVEKQQSIKENETLLFIDEIQGNPNLISLLRYFYEEIPHLHVVTAGSLLEVEMRKANLSMPVGRVQYAYMYPMDFFEYLAAKEEFGLLDYLKKLDFKNSVSESIHKKAVQIFKEYILVGGMPEAVKVFIETDDPNLLSGVYSNLLKSYVDDVYKYTTESEAKYLVEVLKNAPFHSGSKIIYENFADLGYKSREVSKAFSMLEEVMLVNLISATKSVEVPLIKKAKRAKKLIFLDSGFYNYVYNIPFNIKVKDLSSYYRGDIFEQVVGQNIISQKITDKERLFYWGVDRKKGSAEIDFCFANGKDVIGIEVKSGISSRAKSLSVFQDKVKSPKVFKYYPGNITKNKRTSLLSLPIYLIPRIYELL